jgi:hypothetical protein
MAHLELRMLQFLRVRGWPRMTFRDIGELQPKGPRKANFSSFWSRSGGRLRRASLVLKFRKIEIIWLKSQRFRCANSWKRHSEGRFSGKKSVESGVFLVKCVDFCTSSSGNQTNVLLERAETQRNRRLEAGKPPLFRENFSEFRATEGR